MQAEKKRATVEVNQRCKWSNSYSMYVSLWKACDMNIVYSMLGRNACVPCLLLTAACLNVNTYFRKLICDSRSSDSFAERSTVDYIVPGEMELMSAVRWETGAIDMEMPGYQLRPVRPQQLASVLAQKNREKSGEIKFLSRIREEAGTEFCIFEFRLKY